MNRRTLRDEVRRAVLFVAALAAACTGPSSIATLAIDAGRKLLTKTAEKNFGSQYNDNFSRMIDMMMLKTVAGETAAAPPQAEAAAAAPAAAPAPEPPPAALELELAVVREVLLEGRPVPVPVEDGGVLRDGVGRSEEGDNLRIRFEVNEPCHVYAVWVDATAWATPIFPRGPEYAFENPVEPGRTYALPEGDAWFYLDDYRGVENLYFVASREPLQDLDGVLAQLASQQRAFRQDVERPALVDAPGELTRGLAGTRPGRTAIASSDGQHHEVASQAFIAEIGAGDLVVTRWFHHE
jgi:hypothetical protein